MYVKDSLRERGWVPGPEIVPQLAHTCYFLASWRLLSRFVPLRGVWAEHLGNAQVFVSPTRAATIRLGSAGDRPVFSR